MSSVLITGGTGHLGQKVVNSLTTMDCEIAIFSTKTFSPGKKDHITYYKGNLSENIGMKEATKDVDIIIHCASDPWNFKQVDIDGTKYLLKAMDSRTIKNFVYISIVGIDKSDYPYYQAKLEVENVLANSGFPYTILRTTQFHQFIAYIIRSFINGTIKDESILKIPKGLKFQSIDTQEVADLLATISLESPKGLLSDFGGPEILTFEQMTESYLKEFQLNLEIQPEITNDQLHQLFRSGVNLCPNNAFGIKTWNSFLKSINRHQA